MDKRHKIGITLSTLGVVMILFGVTFSFFNYTRTGVSNVIKVGRISFNTEQTNTITLLDVFPIDKQNVNTSSDVGIATITITGDTTYEEGVEYQLTVANLTNTISDKNIPIDVSISASGIGTSDEDYFDNRGGNSSIYKVINNGTIKNNKQLLVGYITKGSTGIDGTVTIKAYLDKEKIAVSDTYDGTESDNMGTPTTWVNDRVVLTTGEWNNLNNSGVSFQVKVEANEGVWVEDTRALSKVRNAIIKKVNAETNSCNPIWIDDMDTANDTSDDITYFSGTNDCVDMNYVWYSGKLWRITAIYPDGAMKLMTENNITSISFNSGSSGNNDRDTSFYTNDTYKSHAYYWLNEDFYDTLYLPDKFIDSTKKWNTTYHNITAVYNEPIERLPETTLINANVGLINDYEYYNSFRCVNSDECLGTTYSQGYLNNKTWWALINSCDWWGDGSLKGVFKVQSGGVGGCSGSSSADGIRPSIIIKSGLEFTGDGTKNNPYKLIGDIGPGTTNSLINTRISGEYVKLKNGANEQLFRIIGIEDNKTKIIAMDYADNGTTRKFATGNSNGDGTIFGQGKTITQDADTWYNYLTSTYYPNLVTTYGELFDTGTYYIGQLNSGDSYKLAICSADTGNTKTCTKVSQTGTFNVGLSRYGEMFAAQQFDNPSNAINFWTITRTSSNVWWITEDSMPSDSMGVTSTMAARPTLHLKSTVKILSGSGTQTDPYVVGL